MSRLRTILKWLAFALAGVVGLLARAVVALHFWLANSPDLGPRLVARVEAVTWSSASASHPSLQTACGSIDDSDKGHRAGAEAAEVVVYLEGLARGRAGDRVGRRGRTGGLRDGRPRGRR